MITDKNPDIGPLLLRSAGVHLDLKKVVVNQCRGSWKVMAHLRIAA